MRRTKQHRGIALGGISLLAGAGAGLLAMYLLDPDSGARRRRRLSRIARDAAESVGDAGAHLVHSSGQYLSQAGHAISELAAQAGHRGSDEAESLWNGARDAIPFERKHSRGIPVAPATASAIGLLALGAGLAWILDPDLGEARRHWLKDKLVSILHDIGTLGRKTGTHLGNRLYGTYSKVRGAFGEHEVSNQQLESRVRAQLGHVVPDLSSITVLAEQGRITLIGSLAGEQIAAAVSAAREVRGVNEVEDLLRPEPLPGSAETRREADRSPASPSL